MKVDGKNDEKKTPILIIWDSITLKQMRDYFFNQSMDEGLDFSLMNLYAEDVELTDQRDTKEEVERMGKKLSRKYS